MLKKIKIKSWIHIKCISFLSPNWYLSQWYEIHTSNISLCVLIAIDPDVAIDRQKIFIH